jgi:phasin family protein
LLQCSATDGALAMTAAYTPFEKFFTPKFDLGALATVQQRNFEAFAAAGQRFVSGVEVLIKRQTELFEAQAAIVKEVLTGAKLPMDVQKQSDFVREQTSKALTDAQELTSIATTAAQDAFEILRKRTEEGVAELTAIAQAA